MRKRCVCECEREKGGEEVEKGAIEAVRTAVTPQGSGLAVGKRPVGKERRRRGRVIARPFASLGNGGECKGSRELRETERLGRVLRVSVD